MKKFLTDENISPRVVDALRADGYDVKDIKEEKKIGITDEEVIVFDRDEDRIILTCDKDFANLLKFPLRFHRGVILLRFSNLLAENIIRLFLPLLEVQLKDNLSGSLVIIKDRYIEIIRE